MFVTPARIRATLSTDRNRCRDASGMRKLPEKIVLGVAEGVTPSSKPPVRIFLGTEPAQYRAERVFVWSIERVRDPSRVYEIFLMKELADFDRSRWLTGFTNYRFAIPHFAGGEGRAIWNDVDEAYLADPAELFDADMQGAGILTVPPLSSGALLDTAVMLIDCARMKEIWPLEAAQNGRKNDLLKKVSAVPGLRGDLSGEWHARDEEYVPGRSKLLHWTILHTQPWWPLPGLFVYQPNPVGRVWYDLKRSADEAGFRVFTADRPSRQYATLRDRTRGAGGVSRNAVSSEPAGLQQLLEREGTRTILHWGFGTAGEIPPFLANMCEQAGVRVETCDPADPAHGTPPSAEFDGVVCAGGLDHLPDEDVPWVIDEMFRRARTFVYTAVHDDPPARTLADGSELVGRARGREWWNELYGAAGIRYPDLHRKLVFIGGDGMFVRETGRRLSGPPEVWVFADGRPEYDRQVTALADALGWSWQLKTPGVGIEDPTSWPDLVISSGRNNAKAVRQLVKDSGGRTRVVHVGREAGSVTAAFDVIVSPGYCHLPPNPRRIETLTPLTAVNPQLLSRARDRWPRLFGQALQPRIVVLVGETVTDHGLSPETARHMGEELRSFACLNGGSLFALTNPRADSAVMGALVAGLGESVHLHSWRPEDRFDSPYFAYLELADILVVTGDSEILLADAVASGKPVHIYPLPQGRPGLKQRVGAAVLARSQARPLNKRGTGRPQQGREYLCARLIERGIVTPPADLHTLHEQLIRRGVAQMFGSPLRSATRPAPLQESYTVAAQVRQLLGMPAVTNFIDGGGDHAIPESRTDQRTGPDRILIPTPVSVDQPAGHTH